MKMLIEEIHVTDDIVKFSTIDAEELIQRELLSRLRKSVEGHFDNSLSNVQWDALVMMCIQFETFWYPLDRSWRAKVSICLASNSTQNFVKEEPNV